MASKAKTSGVRTRESRKKPAAGATRTGRRPDRGPKIARPLQPSIQSPPALLLLPPLAAPALPPLRHYSSLAPSAPLFSGWFGSARCVSLRLARVGEPKRVSGSYAAAMAAPRVNLDGEAIKPLKICMIGAGGFIGSHLCEKLMAETEHSVLAIDIYSDKINHLLQAGQKWSDRIEFHKINIKNDSRLEGLVKVSDLVINLAAICTPADYNTRPLDTIYSNFVDALPVVQYCRENKIRLIHFSTCEVYGKTIGSFLPPGHPLKQDPAFYMLREDETPCIFGSIDKQRWSYACAKQLIERLVYAEGAENGLEFSIVRPFNWIGPRMDFIPGVDGPRDSVPRVLACFSNNLMRGEPLKLVEGGQSQRTFIYIKDAIDVVQRMIENPSRANGQIFNVGNPNNEVTVRELAELMTDVYCKVSGALRPAVATVDVTGMEFYGPGYDDSDKRIPDMTIVKRQLEWEPKTSLYDLMESTLTYQHATYAHAVQRSMAHATAAH